MVLLDLMMSSMRERTSGLTLGTNASWTVKVFLSFEYSELLMASTNSYRNSEIKICSSIMALKLDVYLLRFDASFNRKK